MRLLILAEKQSIITTLLALFPRLESLDLPLQLCPSSDSSLWDDSSAAQGQTEPLEAEQIDNGLDTRGLEESLSLTRGLKEVKVDDWEWVRQGRAL